MNSTEHTLLLVEGMTCGSCVRHVEGALSVLPGVSKVDVDLRSGKVLVAHDNGTPNTNTLIEAINEAGYDASELRQS